MPAEMSFRPVEPLTGEQHAEAARADLVAALYRERDGYLVHGRTDRADQVAAVLRDLGEPVEDVAPNEPPDDPASSEPPDDPAASSEPPDDPAASSEPPAPRTPRRRGGAAQ